MSRESRVSDAIERRCSAKRIEGVVTGDVLEMGKIVDALEYLSSSFDKPLLIICVQGDSGATTLVLL